jgi:iron(III) transport system substrate-binding protein
MITRRLLLTSSAAALCAGALPALGQDWKAEWEATVAAAKKEGAVTVCASSNRSRRDFIVSEWQKEYPEIQISYQVVSGTGFVPAVATERRAGKYLWDVWHNGPPSGLSALHAGLLDPLVPELILPEVRDEAVWGGWDEAFYDPEHRYLLGLFRDITAPYYNAQKIAPERVETLKLKILLEPDLKGKIVWFDPRVQGPGAPYLVLLDHVLGPDTLRKIFTEQDVTFVANDNEAAQAMARGRALVALANRPEEAFREYKSAGLNLDMRSIGNGPDASYVGTGGGTIGLFNNRPHPAAARLFVNWIATKRVGIGLAQAQRLDSARSDVPPLDPNFAVVKGANYVDGQREESDKVVRHWQAQLKTLRPQ